MPRDDIDGRIIAAQSRCRPCEPGGKDGFLEEAGSNWPLKENIGFPMTFLYLGASCTHDARAADRPVIDLAGLCVNTVGVLRLLLGHTLLGLQGP